jgi:ABC-type glycerol-3-phosphate transport system substrate-binding protein
VPLYVANDWSADLTDIVNDDPDWVNVPQVLKDSVTYSDQVLALPAAQFVMGYFVNKDLYEEANLDAPEYGFSVEEFEEAVMELDNIPQGVLGLDEMEFIMGWYANTQDPNLKWFSYDGSLMNYNSAAFKEAIAKAGELRQYTWQGLSEEQLANFNSTGPWEFRRARFGCLRLVDPDRAMTGPRARPPGLDVGLVVVAKSLRDLARREDAKPRAHRHLAPPGHSNQ